MMALTTQDSSLVPAERIAHRCICLVRLSLLYEPFLSCSDLGVIAVNLDLLVPFLGIYRYVKEWATSRLGSAFLFIYLFMSVTLVSGDLDPQFRGSAAGISWVCYFSTMDLVGW